MLRDPAAHHPVRPAGGALRHRRAAQFPLAAGPSWANSGNIDYFLGTDDLGRDILSRLVVGARFTFGNALLVVVIAMVAGTAIGILGGMSKGLKSSVLHHLLDTCSPSPLLAIIMVAILGPGLFNTLIAITLALILPSSGPPTTRSTPRCRRSTSSPAGSTARPLRIMRLAILPNIVETLVAQTTRTLSAAILDISAVGFSRPRRPVTATGMGRHAGRLERSHLSRPWTVTLPGMAILFSVLVTNLVGEGIREALKGE